MASSSVVSSPHWLCKHTCRLYLIHGIQCKVMLNSYMRCSLVSVLNWNPKFTLFISYIRESESIRKINRFHYLTVSPVCETFYSFFAICCFLCLFYFVSHMFLCLTNSRLSLSGAFIVQVHCHDWQLPVPTTLVRLQFLPLYWDWS